MAWSGTSSRPEQAETAESAGVVAVMMPERLAVVISQHGGVNRMRGNPSQRPKEILNSTTFHEPTMVAKMSRELSESVVGNNVEAAPPAAPARLTRPLTMPTCADGMLPGEVFRPGRSSPSARVDRAWPAVDGERRPLRPLGACERRNSVVVL